MPGIFSSSKIELSRSRLENNLAFVKKTLAKNRKLSVVVKGNAYGHGYAEFAPMLCELGVDHFSVFSAQEAFELLKYINGQDIMIIGDVPSEALSWIIDNGIEFFVFNLERLNEVAQVASELKKVAKVHLELETGMKRTGLEPREFNDAIKVLKKNKKHIKLIGLCTHFAGAESISNYLRVKEQIKNFKKFVTLFEQKGCRPIYRHSACSAAAIRYPGTRLDLVRIGILTYGMWPSQEILIDHLKHHSNQFTDPLKRVMEWKTSVMAIKEVEPGDFVGYGTTYQAPKKMKLAVIPIGYETGFSRSLSNKGSVLIGGQYCYVVGTVNMNAITVNVSHVNDVAIGDEVVLIGRQGENEISVAAFSDMGEQLNYELLTRLPGDIPREIVE